MKPLLPFPTPDVLEPAPPQTGRPRKGTPFRAAVPKGAKAAAPGRQDGFLAALGELSREASPKPAAAPVSTPSPLAAAAKPLVARRESLVELRPKAFLASTQPNAAPADSVIDKLHETLAQRAHLAAQAAAQAAIQASTVSLPSPAPGSKTAARPTLTADAVDALRAQVPATVEAERAPAKETAKETAQPATAPESAREPARERFELTLPPPQQAVAAAPEAAPLPTPVQGPQQVAASADASLHGSILARSAHLQLGTTANGRMGLHVRVKDGVADLRVDGPGGAALEGREADLRLALASEGLRLGEFAVTDSSPTPVGAAVSLETTRDALRDPRDLLLTGGLRTTADLAPTVQPGLREPSAALPSQQSTDLGTGTGQQHGRPAEFVDEWPMGTIGPKSAVKLSSTTDETASTNGAGRHHVLA